MNRDIVLTINLEIFQQFADVYTKMDVLDLDSINAISNFRINKIRAVIIDVDNTPDISVEQIRKLIEEQKLRIIFTTNYYKQLSIYRKYASAELKRVDLLCRGVDKCLSQALAISNGEYVFDMERRVLYQNNHEYKMRNTSFLIFRYLVQNSGLVCTREEIIDAVYPVNKLSDCRTIDVHINDIRKTIPNANLITIVNEGYMYAGPQLKLK